MGKSLWLRCPLCGEWCSAKQKNFIERAWQSILQGDQDISEWMGDEADKIGMKGLGKTAGKAINLINVHKHVGEMLCGDNYRFFCKCGNRFGTNQEEMDMSAEHELYLETINIRNAFLNRKNFSEKEQNDFVIKVENTLAKVADASYISDAEATLHDILACCYFYFRNNPSRALLEIEKSLELEDDPQTHILKGMFMESVTDPAESYCKMNELLNVKQPDTYCPYIEKADILHELNCAEKNYANKLLLIPARQRKFLVVTSDYTYLPNTFKVLKFNDTDLGGIIFKDGYPSKNAIYVCHPYKPNVYLSAETYQYDLFENQLNELRELLQCLGAKSIEIECSWAKERSSDGSSKFTGEIGGEYKGVGGNFSGSRQSEDSLMESMVKSILINDSFSYNPEIRPFVPTNIVWYDHLEEWQRLARMRLRGQNTYKFSLSLNNTRIVNQSEADQVNADFNAMVAKGNLGVSKSSELIVSEANSHEVKLFVEFYPLSNYGPSSKKNKTVVCIIIGLGLIISALVAIILLLK